MVVIRRYPSAFDVRVTFNVFPAFLWRWGGDQGVLAQRVHCLARSHYACAIFAVKRFRFVIRLGDQQALDRQCSRLRRLVQVLNALGQFVGHSRGRESNDGCNSVCGAGCFCALRADVRANARAISSNFKGCQDVNFNGAQRAYRCIEDSPK